MTLPRIWGSKAVLRTLLHWVWARKVWAGMDNCMKLPGNDCRNGGCECSTAILQCLDSVSGRAQGLQLVLAGWWQAEVHCHGHDSSLRRWA